MTPHKVMAHQAIIRYQQALQSVYQTDQCQVQSPAKAVGTYNDYTQKNESSHIS